MKFKVSLQEFQDKLQKTLPAVPPKSTLPILEHLNFKIEDNKLKIIGTNQDITIMTTLEVEGESSGSVLVPARKLDAFVKALGNKGDIEFGVDPDNYEINIKTERGSYRMKGLNPDEYLDLPVLFDSKRPDTDYRSTDGTIDTSIPNAVIGKKDIQRLTEKTTFAVSSDEFRPAMTGVLFQFIEDNLHAVATDGYRLVKASAKPEKVSFADETELIIPSKTADLLRKVDGDVIVSIIEGSGSFSNVRFDIGDDTVLISKLIDENFPPYESVIPDNNELFAYVDGKEFSRAIKRISLFSNNISKQIRVDLEENNLKLRSYDEESGNSGEEQITCEYTSEKMEIGFNYSYLEDALQNIDPQDTEDDLVMMTFSEPHKPVLVMPKSDENNLLMLIMPVRL